MGEVATVYRTLLQTLRRHVSHSPESKSLSEHASAIFRQGAETAKNISQKERERAILLAKDYAYLVNGIHDHRELLLSYNIGVDRTEELAARLRSTADRVGLRMPESFRDTEPLQ